MCNFVCTAIGWAISTLGIIQLPIWAFVAIIRQDGLTWSEKIRGAFRPTKKWGPTDPILFEKYQKYLSNYNSNSENNTSNMNLYQRFKKNIFG